MTHQIDPRPAGISAPRKQEREAAKPTCHDCIHCAFIERQGRDWAVECDNPAIGHAFTSPWAVACNRYQKED